MPLRVTEPMVKLMPPMPKTTVRATMIMLRGARRSLPVRTRVLRPTTAMAPKSSSMMPPITGTGTVCSRAPTLPTKARRMAVIAVQVMTAGLQILVRATAPVTSE